MPARTVRLIATAAAALACSAHAAIVTPADPAGWGNAASGGGSTAITGTLPRSGNGSAEITLPTVAAQAMWWYGLETPVPLSSFASASYEFYRDGASTNPGIQAPAYALWLDLDCDANTGADQTYLIYEPGYQTPAPTPVPTDQWVPQTITPTSIVWQNDIGAVAPFMPLSAYIDGSAGTVSGACIVGVLAFAGTGWDGSFHGAVDNVMLSAGGQSLAANFEVSAPPPPPPAPARAHAGRMEPAADRPAAGGPGQSPGRRSTPHAQRRLTTTLAATPATPPCRPSAGRCRLRSRAPRPRRASSG